MDPLLVAYLTSTFVLAATPGATTAVVVRNTIARGTRAGFIAAVGAATGNTTQAVITVGGMALVLQRWPPAFTAVQLAGAAFLLWLGAKSLWRAAAFTGSIRTSAPQAGGSVASSFRQGLFVNLLNPSITTFYVAVVPTFVPAGSPPWYYGALSAAHVAIAFACHSCWALAFGRLRETVTHPLVARALEAITGIVLVALALAVLAG